MKITLPMLGVLVCCLCNSLSSQHLVSAMINACGLEGENEYFLLRNDLDTLLWIHGDHISLRYGSDLFALEDFTESFLPQGNQVFIDSLNSKIVNCDFTFANASENDSIPEGSYFLIFYSDPSIIPDFSDWCNNGMGTIFVTFSSDPSWLPDGNFNSNPSTTRYIKLSLNNDWKMYSYDSTHTSGLDGDFLTWSNQGGSPIDFGNNNSCTPSLQAGLLPIEWIDLQTNYQPESGIVNLVWDIFSTTEIESINVLRSSNGKSFAQIASIVDPYILSSRFSYSDHPTWSGPVYYQLKVNSLDDAATSQISVVHIPDKSLNIYPNPTTGRIILNNQTSFRYEIFTLQGQLLTQDKPEGSSIDVSWLKSGKYYLKISTTQKKFTQLFIKH